jgi:hypothetical protein
MARGGSRQGAGRKPGTPNRKTAEVAEAIDATGMSPLDYLVTLYRDATAEAKDRAWAANAAAPYCHPRMAPTAQRITIDLPDTKAVDGVRDAIAAVVQAIAGGVIAPAEGNSLVAVIEAQRKAIETVDLAARIEALENAAAGGGAR